MFNFVLGDVLVCLTKQFLWPIASLFLETFLESFFWSFGLCYQSFPNCLFIIENTFEHICFLLSFHFLLGTNLQKVFLAFFDCEVTVFVESNFERIPCLFLIFISTFKWALRKVFGFCFLELAFRFATFYWMKVFLLSWVLLLVFRRIVASLIPSKYCKWQKGNLINKNNFHFLLE